MLWPASLPPVSTSLSDFTLCEWLGLPSSARSHRRMAGAVCASWRLHLPVGHRAGSERAWRPSTQRITGSLASIVTRVQALTGWTGATASVSTGVVLQLILSNLDE